jgi:hypothetical protein
MAGAGQVLSRMKTKQSITASVALAAIATAWLGKHRQNAIKRERKFEEKRQREALDTFEGEGGLVLG